MMKIAELTHKQPIGQNAIQSLSAFLEEWDTNYTKRVADIPLFDAEKTSQWTQEQKIHFIKVFYHIRGHFHELMWFIASYAPNKKPKDMILCNMSDEMGEHGFSHEKLYGITAEAVGVDITKEYIEHENYLDFCKEFNRGHLRWLRDNDWNSNISAFAALERLDNVDYTKGKLLAESIGLTGKALIFFNVHIHVKHFQEVLELIIEVWDEAPEKVKMAFNFIADHQIKMWQDLSDEIFNFCNAGGKCQKF